MTTKTKLIVLGEIRSIAKVWSGLSCCDSLMSGARLLAINVLSVEATFSEAERMVDEAISEGRSAAEVVSEEMEAVSR